MNFPTGLFMSQSDSFLTKKTKQKEIPRSSSKFVDATKSFFEEDVFIRALFSLSVKLLVCFDSCWIWNFTQNPIFIG